MSDDSEILFLEYITIKTVVIKLKYIAISFSRLHLFFVGSVSDVINPFDATCCDKTQTLNRVLSGPRFQLENNLIIFDNI